MKPDKKLLYTDRYSNPNGSGVVVVEPGGKASGRHKSRRVPPSHSFLIRDQRFVMA